MRKSIRIALWAIASSVLILVLVFAFFYRSVSIKETPTCVRYVVGANNKGEVSRLVGETLKTLLARAFQENAHRGDTHILSNKTTQVAYCP